MMRPEECWDSCDGTDQVLVELKTLKKFGR